MPRGGWKGSRRSPRREESGAGTFGTSRPGDRRSPSDASAEGPGSSLFDQLSPHFLAKGRVNAARSVNVTLSYAQALEGVEVEISPREPDAIRVLFVEDDTSVAQMYKLKLELDGCVVDIASDGEMALEMAGRDLPDIIFLDVRLPKLDGFGVLKALRADSK